MLAQNQGYYKPEIIEKFQAALAAVIVSIVHVAALDAGKRKKATREPLKCIDQWASEY